MTEFGLDRRIAIIYDFDLTLTEHYMQIPLFEKYLDNLRHAYKGIKDRNGETINFDRPDDYFRVVDSWAEPNNGIAYVTNIIYDIGRGVFPELTNQDLNDFGKEIKLAPGIPEYFGELNRQWEGQCEIKHYIVSVGFEEMIRGAGLEKHVDGIFGTKLISLKNHFNPEEKKAIDGISSVMTPFGKSKAIIEVAKGGSKNVDKLMGHIEYTYDYRNIMTKGDSGTDVSQFSYLGNKGADSQCLYKIGDEEEFNRIFENRKVRERVGALMQRDFRVGSYMWVYDNQRINQMINRKCHFDPIVLSMYRKKKIRYDKLKDAVINHIIEDKCLECKPLFTYSWEPPR